MTLFQHLEQVKTQFEQAKASANFLAGQIAMLETLISEQGGQGQIPQDVDGRGESE